MSLHKSTSTVGPNHYLYNSGKNSLSKAPICAVQVKLKSNVKQNAYADGPVPTTLGNNAEKSMRSTDENNFGPDFK